MRHNFSFYVDKIIISMIISIRYGKNCSQTKPMCYRLSAPIYSGARWNQIVKKENTS
uniref:Uncharacterized protein n=1 Tax=Rhizophora mucronata TaxID=61149 RepID=A0A2P2PPU3_RHIMU